ncbi:MAG: hypothetical protein KA313_11600 [Pseudarcicella sp.]|nr:hypothetical protein [Pseudarcicella sp.]
MDYRIISNEEIQELDTDFQSGLEFIGWYVDFPEHTEWDDIIKLLQECVENVKNNKISFPIDRYENYEDITYILGAVYTQCYTNKFGWEIVFLNDIEEYSLLSIDGKFGIRYHALLYKILTGLQENTIVLGYNMIDKNIFPESTNNQLEFIW